MEREPDDVSKFPQIYWKGKIKLNWKLDKRIRVRKGRIPDCTSEKEERYYKMEIETRMKKKYLKKEKEWGVNFVKIKRMEQVIGQ